MGTKYSSNAESGYNATPPADDGTVSEANKVKWSTIKTKLGDPIKSLAETINSELVTHFDHGPTALTTNTTLGASHYEQFIQVSGSGVTLTLSDAATLGAGWNCEIHSTDSSNDVSIARATASDTINSLSNNFVLLPLQSVKVLVNAAANGFIVRDFSNLQSTDAGAAVGPSHTLYRNSASPAANDLLGAYNFDGEDSAGNRTTYARIYSQIDDPGNTSEDGSLKIDVMKAGTLTLAATLSQSALNLASGFSFQENGTAIAGASSGSSLVLVSSQTASASATLDFTGIDSTYDKIKFVMVGILPATDNVTFNIRVGTGAGPTYQSGASDYQSIGYGKQSAGDRAYATTSTKVDLHNVADTLSNATGANRIGYTGELTLFNPGDAVNIKTVQWHGTHSSSASSSNTLNYTTGGGFYMGTAAVTAVRFLFSSGNIASGTIYMYGIKKS